MTGDPETDQSDRTPVRAEVWRHAEISLLIRSSPGSEPLANLSGRCLHIHWIAAERRRPAAMGTARVAYGSPAHTNEEYRVAKGEQDAA